MAGMYYEHGQDMRLEVDCLYTVVVIPFRHRNDDTYRINVRL